VGKELVTGGGLLSQTVHFYCWPGTVPHSCVAYLHACFLGEPPLPAIMPVMFAEIKEK